MTTNVDIHFSDGFNHDPRDDGDSPNVEVIVANIKSNVTNTNRDASASASASEYGNATKTKLGLPFGSAANQGPEAEDEDKGEGCEEEDDDEGRRRRTSKRGKGSTHCGRVRKRIGNRKNLIFGISILLNILLASYIIDARVRNNRIVSNAAVDAGRNRTSAHAACHCHAKTAKNNKETTSGPSMNPSTSMSVLPSLKPSFDTSDPSSGPSVNPSTSVLPSLKPSLDTSDPSSGPSVNPSLTRTMEIKNVLLFFNVSSMVALDDPSSPQGKALSWVSTEDTIDPPLEPGTADDDRIIQRYVLVVFYYATGGDGWTNKEGWLGGSNECDWFKVDCIFGGDMVTLLSPTVNNLVGSLPSEVGSLGNLAYLDLGRNQFTDEPYLSRNQLSGGIPSELGGLSRLAYLDLSRNQLSGGIPSELGGLSRLGFLVLSSNQLSGPIPSQLGQLSLVVVLALNHNDLTGGVPEDLRELFNLRKCYHSAERMFSLILSLNLTRSLVLTASSHFFVTPFLMVTHGHCYRITSG